MSLINIFQGMNTIENAIDKVTPKVSLETFLDSVGDTIDTEINRNHEVGLQFLGGKAIFSLSEQNMIQINVCNYYIKKDGSCVKKENTGLYPMYLLKSEAREEMIGYLDENGEYILEIENP